MVKSKVVVVVLWKVCIEPAFVPNAHHFHVHFALFHYRWLQEIAKPN